MDVILDKGELSSSSSNLNFVAKSDNIYVIDNHLAAFWCWLQLPLENSYKLLHIDRHYDLVPYVHECNNQIHDFEWNGIAPEDLLTMKYTKHGCEGQVIRWDNYINLFKELHPNFFSSATFVTQKNGSLDYDGEYVEKELYEVEGVGVRKQDNVILNLDIDYFFTNIGDEIIQKYTDEYIINVAEWVKSERNNFVQIIICLSPECSINWTEAKRIANIFLKQLNLNLN